MLVIALLVGIIAFLRRRVEWGTGWMWPVPNLLTKDGILYKATITDEPGTPRGEDVHRGVDIMYERRSKADRPEFKPGTSSGTPKFFAPSNMVPVVAAKDGTIWSASKEPTGWTVVIDHGKPFATYYTHLVALAVAPHANGKNTATGKPTHVRAGDVIGVMGWSPRDAQKLTHLHFSVAHNGPPEGAAVDPSEAMRTWDRPPTTFKL